MTKKLFIFSFLLILILPFFFYQSKDGEFDESFGFSEELISLNKDLKYSLLNSSPNDDVLVGNDSWLYLSESLTTPALKEEEIEQLATELKLLQQRIGQNKFLFVLVPDKKTFVPKGLPRRFSANDESYVTFLNSLKEKDVNFVDSFAVLSDRIHPYFSKTDTHWNRLGAYKVYAAILQNLNLPAPELKGVDYYTRYGDLARLIDLEFEEQTLKPILGEKQSIDQDLLIYIDSFGEGLLPFFQDQFTKVSFKNIWETCPFDLNNFKEHDLVIVQIVERDLSTLLGELCQT